MTQLFGIDEAEDPDVERMLYEQYSARATLPTTNPAKWAAMCEEVDKHLLHLGVPPPTLITGTSVQDKAPEADDWRLPAPVTPVTTSAEAYDASIAVSSMVDEFLDSLGAAPVCGDSQPAQTALDPRRGGWPDAEGDRQEDPDGGLHGTVSAAACRTVPTTGAYQGSGTYVADSKRICLNAETLNWLEQSHGIKCTLDASCPEHLTRSSVVSGTQCSPSAFLEMELQAQVVYLQPTQEEFLPAIQHLLRCKAQHPQVGALLVVPASVAFTVSHELDKFDLVHTLPRGQKAFVSRTTAKRCGHEASVHVYVMQPACQSGVTVAQTGDVELMFNLPCTIAGGTGTLHINSRSLIDTGCGAYSLLSSRAAARLALKIQPCTQDFALADGTKLRCDGIAVIKMRLQKHTFNVTAYVVDMNDTFDLILGQQWLMQHRAVIDFDRHTVTLKKSDKSVTIRACPAKMSHATPRKSRPASKPLSVSAVARHMRKGGHTYEFRINAVASKYGGEESGTSDDTFASHVQKIRTEYADRFVADLPPHQKGPVAPEIAQLNPDATKPPYTPAYRASPREIEEMKKQVQDGMAAGRIRVSNSPYGSGVLFVVKKDGSLRMCVDYRRLNKQVVKQRHPLPRIDDLLDKFGNASVFSLLDLKAGYAQIRMHPNDVPKSAFVTPFGHYEYLIIPFGMANAPSAFSRLMQHVLRPVLDKCAVVYLDDILIYSPSAEQHAKDLATVLQLLRDHDLYANSEKCTLFTAEVKYLGHIINKSGISVDLDKTHKLREWPVPASVKEVQSFLGLCNYFRRFIPKYSEIARPLTDLTAKNKWHTPLTAAELDAFHKLKHTLVSPPVLAIPQFDKPFEVYTDASEFACGAVLIQEGRHVAYMSKKFTPAEQNYPTHDRECLGIVSAYREWRCYLEGVASTCYTDHKPLTQIQLQPKISRRQARWLEFLSSFQPNVVYVQGSHNPADVLSRPPHELSLAPHDCAGAGAHALVPLLDQQGGVSGCVQPSPVEKGCDSSLPPYPQLLNNSGVLHTLESVLLGPKIPVLGGRKDKIRVLWTNFLIILLSHHHRHGLTACRPSAAYRSWRGSMVVYINGLLC